MGGDCLNTGCVPSKALLRSADVAGQMRRAKEFGLKADNIGYDLDAVVKRSRAVAGQLSGGIEGVGGEDGRLLERRVELRLRLHEGHGR